MEIGPGSPRPALTRVTVWVTAPLCKGGAGVRGVFLTYVRGLLLTLMPGRRFAPRRSSFFFKKKQNPTASGGHRSARNPIVLKLLMINSLIRGRALARVVGSPGAEANPPAFERLLERAVLTGGFSTERVPGCVGVCVGWGGVCVCACVHSGRCVIGFPGSPSALSARSAWMSD